MFETSGHGLDACATSQGKYRLVAGHGRGALLDKFILALPFDSQFLDLDLPARFDEIAAATRLKVAEEFAKYGLELADFFINAITPPEEVQKAIDTRSSMGAIGDLRAFTMYQAANSMAKMAEHGGGDSGGSAMGMGMGAGFGMMMPAMLQQAMQGQGTAGAPATPGGPPAATPAAPAPTYAAPARVGVNSRKKI